MSEYTASIKWYRAENEQFIDKHYSRGHQWFFDGGVSVPASSAPSIVPLPYSIEENVDPEEAFVASLASCHMLFFLQLAAENSFVVNEYVDTAFGKLEKNEQGKLLMSVVTLRPMVNFSEEKVPTPLEQKNLHHRAHELCFIANSVKTEINIEL